MMRNGLSSPVSHVQKLSQPGDVPWASCDINAILSELQLTLQIENATIISMPAGETAPAF